MTVDLTYQAEVPAVAGVKAAMQAAVPGLRVDELVVRGDVESPMVLLELGGPSFRIENMADLVDVVVVRVDATCIGESVELVTQLRGKLVRSVIGRNPATRQFWTPLTVTGMVVVDRDLQDRTLPPPQMRGAWANARLPISLVLQPTS